VRNGIHAGGGKDTLAQTQTRSGRVLRPSFGRIADCKARPRIFPNVGVDPCEPFGSLCFATRRATTDAPPTDQALSNQKGTKKPRDGFPSRGDELLSRCALLSLLFRHWRGLSFSFGVLVLVVVLRSGDRFVVNGVRQRR